ncbi:hypothetical protein I312_105093 [Cryptococcus bacillisporus CA1280]|uniref:uncharacterized protein n=1 Tax=Cryptococcus bacillisporus CA1280 TaxID=1296109 RepID=UPI003367398F
MEEKMVKRSNRAFERASASDDNRKKFRGRSHITIQFTRTSIATKQLLHPENYSKYHGKLPVIPSFTSLFPPLPKIHARSHLGALQSAIVTGMRALV